MSTLIRPARPDDLPAIHAVGIDADARFIEVGYPEFADGGTIPAATAEQAMRDGRLWVATRDSEVIGWAYVGRLDGELCLGQISVARAWGRQGVGTDLLRRVIDDAVRRGEPSIVLNTQTDVPWNAPWYARHGFVVIEQAALTPALRRLTEQQEALGMDWGRRVHMRLSLSPPGPQGSAGS